MTITIFLVSLIGAMALGVPIAFSLLVCGVALMWHMDMFDAQILAQNLMEGANSFPLLAVPFFMLAGEVMNAGGLSRRIVNFAMALVGHIKGGLGYVTIMAAVIMAALSGSAVADAAALAALLMPMMVAAGHDKARSAGLIASAGIIAPVIPPSIGFVIFGVAGNVSISKLFMAGIVPGMMLGVALWVTWWWLARREVVQVPPQPTKMARMDRPPPIAAHQSLMPGVAVLVTAALVLELEALAAAALGDLVLMEPRGQPIQAAAAAVKAPRRPVRALWSPLSKPSTVPITAVPSRSVSRPQPSR